MNRITNEWLVYQNDKYHFLLKYPPDEETIIDNDHIRIRFPIFTGINLQEKSLTISVSQGENIYFQKLGIPVEKRKVRIGRTTFLREIGAEGFAGHYAQSIRYTTSRENVFVTITLQLIFINELVFYPRLITRVDLDAEQEMIKLMAGTFTWLG